MFLFISFSLPFVCIPPYAVMSRVLLPWECNLLFSELASLWLVMWVMHILIDLVEFVICLKKTTTKKQPLFLGYFSCEACCDFLSITFMKAQSNDRSLVVDWICYLYSFLIQYMDSWEMFSLYLNDSHSSHLPPVRNRNCTGFLGQSAILCPRKPADSHSITYLCNNMTAEKPSKQPCSQTKPAASTAKCSSGVIVLQLIVWTIVRIHISFFSHSYVTCDTSNSVLILTCSTTTTSSSLSALTLNMWAYFGVVFCTVYC